MRRAVIQLHLWLGITVGLLWALQGLTGSILVFHRELARVIVPAATPGPMTSIDKMLISGSNAAAGAAIVRLSVADAKRDRVHAYYSDSQGAAPLRFIVLDAATAQPIGTGEDHPKTPFSGSALRWIFLLHETLLSGAVGEIAIGVTGLLLLSTAIAGLWLAWPPPRGWSAVFSWRRWKKPQHQLYGWHRAIGLTIGFLFLPIAVTGAYMSFDRWLDPALGRFKPDHELQSAPHAAPPAGPVISAQQALEKAAAQFPGAQWIRLYLPSHPTSFYSVQLHQPGESRAWIGRTFVTVGVHGDILNVHDALTAHPKDRVLDLAYPLHNGEIAGWFGRIGILLAGLSLPTLLVTGAMAWLGKRRRSTASVQYRPRNEMP